MCISLIIFPFAGENNSDQFTRDSSHLYTITTRYVLFHYYKTSVLRLPGQNGARTSSFLPFEWRPVTEGFL